jgi:Asp-tRNA(Asn)/Glu-tRNA(Gln) amidotransferase A subunit family amidase
MIQAGINTRVGPICRTVADTAKVLQAIAGYDPKDELTVFSLGRTPSQPYPTFASATRLDGMRIGVVREYMDKSLFTQMDEQTIDLVSRAAEDMKALGADIVDPGEGGSLFGECLRKYNPQMHNAIFTRQFPDLFPFEADGKPKGDHLATLVAMAQDPTLVPAGLSLRDLGQAQATGEGRYMMNRYLAERGDAAIKSNADLAAKANFHQDPQFPDRKLARERQEQTKELNMADRMLKRFAVQQVVLQCMATQGLDALVYPTSNLPPAKLGAPGEPSKNGRGGSWSMLGQQGFPAITVPAGFTTEVYDRVRDPGTPIRAPEGGGGDGASEEGTHVVGPIAAKLPVGMDIVGRPFDEPTLFLIASAYEAATRHRSPPPDFGALPGEP